MTCFTIMKSVKYQLTGRKLVWNLLFYVGQMLIFGGAWYYRAHDQRLNTLNQITICFGIASASALVLCVDAMILLLPALRNLATFLRPALGSWLPVDEGFYLHRQMAYSLLFWTVVHTTAHYINYMEIEITQVRPVLAYQKMFMEPAGITGHAMLVIMFIMYTLAHKKMRNICYESFWWSHHLGLLFIIALYTHATGCFVRGNLPGQPVQCLGYSAWKWTRWVAGLYVIERVVRVIRSHRSTTLIQAIHHPCDVLEIRFLKPSLNYKPGQFIYLNCAELGKNFEWHPFSISSAPSDSYISVHIRQAGDFTKAISDRLRNSNTSVYNFNKNGSTDFSIKSNSLKAGSNSSDSLKSQSSSLNSRSSSFEDLVLLPSFSFPKIMIDGPYGSPAQDVSKVNVAVLVGAGIGVTPFASILKNIYYLHKNKKLGNLRHVHFIWVCRDVGSFTWFQSLLSDLENTRSLSGFLTISLYLTKIDSTIRSIAKHEVLSKQSVDSFTNLRSPTQFGRPNFSSILEKVRIDVEEGTYDIRRVSVVKKVGVFFCGPPALGKQLQKDSSSVSTEFTKFVFVKEKF